MKIVQTGLPGVLLIEPVVFPDSRGHFLEIYHEGHYVEQGLPMHFVQDNVSFSIQGVMRGLHYQLDRPQGKLVMAMTGEIYDVAVDVRPGSPTFGKWAALTLSAKGHRQLYITEGFAHGFCVLSKTATVLYKCTDFYDPKEERGIKWDSPSLDIPWPVSVPIISEKDEAYLPLDKINPKDLPLFRGTGNA